MDNKNEVSFTDYERRSLPRDFYNDEQTFETEQSTEKTTETPRNIGNKALSVPSENLEDVRTENVAETQVPTDNNYPPRNPNASIIKTTEKLSSEAVEAIDDAINTFDKNGKAAEFYDDVRNYMEDNLRNSYKRELSYNKESEK